MSISIAWFAWVQILLRWTHVGASFFWLGFLYFFLFVQAQTARSLDAAARRAVLPQLLPRALFWFRWAAVWTWATGFALAVLLYYPGIFARRENDPRPWMGVALLLGLLAAGLILYELIMRRVSSPVAANALALALFFAFWAALVRTGTSGAALYVHAGIAMGTVMASNVWLVVWPAQRRMIDAIREGNPPDPEDGRVVASRARQNAYMSLPLLFFMTANHYPTIVYATDPLAGLPLRDWYLILVLAVGFVAMRLLLAKADRA